MEKAMKNRMMWNCERDGCFNILKRPKLEHLSEALPGKCAFGDVDGIAEINGYGLLLEWKPAPVALSEGQRIMYERLTRSKILTVLVIAGDARTMAISHVAHFFRGKWTGWQASSLDGVRTAIRSWVAWTDKP
jgi:hypothetical protein